MDPSGLIGLFLALGAVYALMVAEGTTLGAILLPGPLILVFVGTFGAAIAGTTLRDSIHALKNFPRALTGAGPKPGKNIDTIVNLADRARREGLLALEDEMRNIDDEFLRKGLSAAIDGTDVEDLREVLGNQIDTKRAQDKVAYSFFNQMGGYAPTIGVVGTVVSLVHVLENLTDVAALGPMIAAAFVATLWGVLSANMIWLPVGGRLKRISELECEDMEVTLEGVIALQSGANPRMVGERLRSLLPESQDKKAA